LRQDSVPQHCEEELQEAPWLKQDAPPLQTPPVQVREAQHWLELVQEVPTAWQPPPEQTLLALQVSTPQQSPLVSQR